MKEAEDDLAKMKSPQKSKCNLKPVGMMLALSTHAIFEGIALGLTTEWVSACIFGTAIFIHKWAEAVSLGVSFRKSLEKKKCLCFILTFLFSCDTPLGVFIGLMISDSNTMVEIVFNSLVCGVFIYIACSEIIVQEFNGHKLTYFKMLLFMLGAALVTGLGFIPEE